LETPTPAVSGKARGMPVISPTGSAKPAEFAADAGVAITAATTETVATLASAKSAWGSETQFVV
jgi:hypothetical protein